MYELTFFLPSQGTSSLIKFKDSSFSFDRPLACEAELLESREGCHLCSHTLKIKESGRDVLKKSYKSLLGAQKPIGPQGLHETLCRSFPKSVLERGPIKFPFLQPIIKRQKFILFPAGKIHIGIPKE